MTLLSDHNNKMEKEFDDRFGFIERNGRLNLKPIKTFIAEQNKVLLEKVVDEFESIHAGVIDTIYLQYKRDFVDWENKTHKLGWFKENVKQLYYLSLREHLQRNELATTKQNTK